MHIAIHQKAKRPIAELISDTIVIKEVQDALDLMANANSSGANSLIIHEHQIIPEFFDLQTGVAGEIMQKFSNYRMKLAIVGDFTKYKSKSLQDFIFESNKRGIVLFLSSVKDAINALRD
jgi:hypothetical protein